MIPYRTKNTTASTVGSPSLSIVDGVISVLFGYGLGGLWVSIWFLLLFVIASRGTALLLRYSPKEEEGLTMAHNDGSSSQEDHFGILEDDFFSVTSENGAVGGDDIELISDDEASMDGLAVRRSSETAGGASMNVETPRPDETAGMGMNLPATESSTGAATTYVVSRDVVYIKSRSGLVGGPARISKAYVVDGSELYDVKYVISGGNTKVPVADIKNNPWEELAPRPRGRTVSCSTQLSCTSCSGKIM